MYSKELGCFRGLIWGLKKLLDWWSHGLTLLIPYHRMQFVLPKQASAGMKLAFFPPCWRFISCKLLQASLLQGFIQK